MKSLVFSNIIDFKQIKLRTSTSKYYLVVWIFVIANILLPLLVHQFTINGIPAWKVILPIYFFVLIAWFQFWFNVALATAIFSPLISYLIIGMPAAEILPIILIKTILLALSSSYIATRIKKLNIWHIFLAVLIYQILGLAIGYFLVPNSFLLDIQLGYPWIILQIILGFLLLIFLNKFLHEDKRI